MCQQYGTWHTLGLHVSVDEPWGTRECSVEAQTVTHTWPEAANPAWTPQAWGSVWSQSRPRVNWWVRLGWHHTGTTSDSHTAVNSEISQEDKVSRRFDFWTLRFIITLPFPIINCHNVQPEYRLMILPVYPTCAAADAVRSVWSADSRVRSAAQVAADMYQ